MLKGVCSGLYLYINMSIHLYIYTCVCVYACVHIVNGGGNISFILMLFLLASFGRILGDVIPVCSRLLAPYSLEPEI